MNIRRVLLVALINLGLVVLTTNGHGAGPAAYGSLVPLLPIAAITGHSGLLTAGLTGAALLKLKAAAAIFAFLSARRKKHRSHGHGWHQGGKGGGWHERGKEGGWHGGGKGGHHRRRRSVEAVDAGTGAIVNPDISQYDPSLDEVLEYDQLGCGMRLVCELSAAPKDALFDDEKIILELFGRGEKAPNPAKASRGKLSYSYAALLGENAKDFSVCSNVYGRCPYSANEVMRSLRDANV